MKKRLITIVAILILAVATPVMASNWIITTNDPVLGILAYEGGSVSHFVNRNNVNVTSGIVRFRAIEGWWTDDQIYIRDTDYAYIEARSCTYNSNGTLRRACVDKTRNGLRAINYGTNLWVLIDAMVKHNTGRVD